MMEKISDYMASLYTPFEQGIALAWSQAHLSAFIAANPNSSCDERQKVFLDALDGGLGLALEFRKSNT